MEKEMIKKTQDYLTAVAMGAVNHSEGLGIATEDLSSKFAMILREYPETIEKFTPQEVALFLAFSSDVNSKFYDEYVKVFLNKALLSSIIETNGNIDEQMQLLYETENDYYETGLDSGSTLELCDFLNSVSHNIRFSSTKSNTTGDIQKSDSEKNKIQSR